MAKTYEERVEDLEQRITQMQTLRKELIAKQKVQDRKNRTHRLIQIGAVMEEGFGEEIDPEIFAAYLKTTIRKSDGTEMTVAESQKHFYERAKDRIRNENTGTSGINL